MLPVPLKPKIPEKKISTAATITKIKKIFIIVLFFI
jgi:hypothetical protein